MDAKPSSNAERGGEISMAEKRSGTTGDVVITVSREGAPKDQKVSSSPKEGEYLAPKETRQDSFHNASAESGTTTNGLAKSVPLDSPSPEISRFSLSANKPPKIPSRTETLTFRRSLSRSVYSKPKSRFVEQSYPLDPGLAEDNGLSLQEQIGANSASGNSFDKVSPNNKSTRSIRSNSMTPKAQASPAGPGEDEDEDEEIYKKVKLNKEKRRRFSAKFLIELVVSASMLGLLIASLTVDALKKCVIWGLEIWKWCVLAMVIFCGMLVTNWFMHLIVFLIEKNFLLRRKVLYFVHGLKKTVQVFIWLSLVLVTWVLLFKRGVKRSDTATKILSHVTWTIVSLLIGAFLWLLKTLLLKILASNFNVNTFFDRIQESVFHQYVLQTLSGPPLIEQAERVGRSPSTGKLSFRSTKKGKVAEEKKLIDMGKVHKMKQEKVSAWTMRVLVEAVRSSGLSTISNTLEESAFGEGNEQTDREITSEMEAIAAAYDIFKNVAQRDCHYIDEDDLLRFMIKEEVDLVFPLFEGAETGKIDRKALTDWVVKVYKGRKALAHALNDTKTGVKQLNKLVTGILIVGTFIIWLLLMGIATTKVILFLSSQLVVAAFMFGNTCKTIFEAIIFVFVMHPFDVGDRCVVDGIPLLVEEMNILTTVFLKLDNEKVFYPNSVLSTKPISNYYRSPEMGDTLEFSIDFATPLKKIGLLKDRIKDYLERNPHHWQANHNVVVKEIENVNKLKMALYCNHTISFQDYAEKNRRRTELVMELKKIFEELEIKYYLLPQKVHLSHIESEPDTMTNR